jgi:predicted metal-dependent hydrolase
MDEVAFQLAVAQFNAGEFFDCHETLEPLWLAASSDERIFLHAFIQLAVALHHHQHGNLKGARSVAGRALQKLNSLASHPLSHLNESLCAFFTALPEGATTYPHLTLSDEYQN